MTDIHQSNSAEIKRFPVGDLKKNQHDWQTNKRKINPLLQGWSFIRYHEDETLNTAVDGLLEFDGPVVAYNPHMTNMRRLSDPHNMIHWLRFVFERLCYGLVKAEIDGDEDTAQGSGWDEFRELITTQSNMTMQELAKSAKRSSIRDTAEYMVDVLLIETRMMNKLTCLCAGESFLKTA